MFVEGRDEFSFDPHVLDFLLQPFGVEVMPVGGAENVMAAVHALSWEGAPRRVVEGSDYYSVIDRDHRLDEDVEKGWAGGPFAGERRDLVWRRCQFEDYFLEPEFVAQSRYFRDTDRQPGDIWDALLRAANGRVFLDAANLVLMEVRDALQKVDIPKFSLGDGDFETLEGAEDALTARDFPRVRSQAEEQTSADWLATRFRENVQMLFRADECDELRPNRGRWLERMEGSALIGAALSPRFFLVRGSDGKPLQGPPLWRRVARNLMLRFDDLDVKPQDLVELRDYFEATRPARFPSP
jgi:hypothetical protein